MQTVQTLAKIISTFQPLASCQRLETWTPLSKSSSYTTVLHIIIIRSIPVFNIKIAAVFFAVLISSTVISEHLQDHLHLLKLKLRLLDGIKVKGILTSQTPPILRTTSSLLNRVSPPFRTFLKQDNTMKSTCTYISYL